MNCLSCGVWGISVNCLSSYVLGIAVNCVSCGVLGIAVNCLSCGVWGIAVNCLSCGAFVSWTEKYKASSVASCDVVHSVVWCVHSALFSLRSCPCEIGRWGT